jgi:hypothetical protein
MKGSDDRFVAEVQAHSQVLECLHPLMQLIPLSLLSSSDTIRQVRATTEVFSFVADHHANPRAIL